MGNNISSCIQRESEISLDCKNQSLKKNNELDLSLGSVFSSLSNQNENSDEINQNLTHRSITSELNMKEFEETPQNEKINK